MTLSRRAGPGPDPAFPPGSAMADAMGPLAPLAADSSPWSAVTFQDEGRIRHSLGRPLALPLDAAHEDLPDATEAWLTRKGPNLTRPLLDSLGLQDWFKGPELSFDGRELHTPLERLAALHEDLPLRREGGPHPVKLKLQPLGFLQNRPPARLLLRPTPSLQAVLDHERTALTWRRCVTSWLSLDAGLSYRYGHSPHARLGATAVTEAGWRVELVLGSRVDAGTLSAPVDLGPDGAPGLVIAVSHSF